MSQLVGVVDDQRQQHKITLLDRLCQVGHTIGSSHQGEKFSLDLNLAPLTIESHSAMHIASAEWRANRFRVKCEHRELMWIRGAQCTTATTTIATTTTTTTKYCLLYVLLTQTKCLI